MTSGNAAGMERGLQILMNAPCGYVFADIWATCELFTALIAAIKFVNLLYVSRRILLQLLRLQLVDS